MAAVWITIDYLDGRTTVKGPLYPDDLNLTGMLFKLAESGIASVTFANADPLGYLRREHQGSIPWCEKCKSYHPDTTPHIRQEPHNAVPAINGTPPRNQ